MRNHLDEAANGHSRGKHQPPSQRDQHTQAALGPENNDRGRSADKPSEIPARGWKDVLKRVKGKLATHNIPMIAGGIAFFAMLAVFPALIAAVSLYGLLFSPAEVEEQIQAAARVLPQEARNVLRDQLRALVSRGNTGLGWGAALGILGALFSASAGTEKLMDAIGIAYEQPNKRGMVKQRGLALLLTLGFFAAGIAAFATVAVLPAVLDFLHIGGLGPLFLRYGRWPALALIVMVGLGVLYAVAPNRERARWRWISWGAVIATGLWIAASAGLSLYVSYFSSFGETYGTIGGVIALMLWMYLSAFALLLGAELNAESEAQTTKDSTVGPSKPMGERGAVKADELGKAGNAHH